MKKDYKMYNLAHQWGREAEAYFKEAREILEEEGDKVWALSRVALGEETYLHASQLLDMFKPEPLSKEDQKIDRLVSAISDL